MKKIVTVNNFKKILFKENLNSIEELFFDDSVLSLSQNQKEDKYIYDEDIIELIMSKNNEQLNLLIAEKQYLSTNILKKLSTKESSVRYQIILNKNITQEILIALTQDKNKDIKNLAKQFLN